MLKFLVSVSLLLVLCCPGFSQVASSELSGSVLDSTSAAVAGAKVTATNTATNLSRDTTSDSSGRYVVPLLPPGDYVVTVEAPGFRKLVQKGLS